MTKHKEDGITYKKPAIYKCKLCGQRLTKEQMKTTTCEDF